MLFEWYAHLLQCSKGLILIVLSVWVPERLTCSQNVLSSRKQVIPTQSPTWPQQIGTHYKSRRALLLLLHEPFIRASCFTSDRITVIVSHTCQQRLICKPTCFDSSDPMSWHWVIILFIDLSPLTGHALWSISIQKHLWETVHIRFALQNIPRQCCWVLQHKRERKKITWNVQFQVLGVVSLEMPVENFQVLTSWTQVH